MEPDAGVLHGRRSPSIGTERTRGGRCLPASRSWRSSFTLVEQTGTSPYICTVLICFQLNPGNSWNEKCMWRFSQYFLSYLMPFLVFSPFFFYGLAYAVVFLSFWFSFLFLFFFVLFFFSFFFFFIFSRDGTLSPPQGFWPSARRASISVHPAPLSSAKNKQTNKQTNKLWTVSINLMQTAVL